MLSSTRRKLEADAARSLAEVGMARHALIKAHDLLALILTRILPRSELPSIDPAKFVAISDLDEDVKAWLLRGGRRSDPIGQPAVREPKGDA